MKENKEYIITDTEEFVHLMRSTAASSLAEEYMGKTKEYSDKDLDGITTLSQVESIIAEKSIDIDEESKYIINGDIFEDIFDEVRNLIYQSAMSQLAAKGYIECAWDDKKNKMIFWVDKEKDDTYNK
tara:strand:+ start:324 stop:704 length:381 start_codon:yes stop_codon:yes gene_type:complete